MYSVHKLYLCAARRRYPDCARHDREVVTSTEQSEWKSPDIEKE